MTSPAHTPFNAINDLAARWIATLPNKATVFSPVGVWPVLAILADAATDDVKADLEEALCFKETRERDLSDAALRTLEFLDKNELLDAAVAVWVSKKLGVKEEWLGRLPEASRGLLTKTPRDKAVLDQWARAHTRDIFTSFPATIEKIDDMVLASAIALNMRWPKPFHLAEGGRLKTSMRGLDIIRTTEGITTVRIRGIKTQRSWGPSPSVDCFLVIGEPDAVAAEVLSRGHALVRKYGTLPTTYKEALEMSGPSLTRRVRENHRKADNEEPFISISTRGFKVEAKHDLLRNGVFGLERASSQASERSEHFPGITDSPLWVNGASQSALARFHSEGFSAAAITTFSGKGAARPRPGRALFLDINIDRPFGFLCIESESKVVDFAGWVTEEEFMDNEDDLKLNKRLKTEPDSEEDEETTDDE